MSKVKLYAILVILILLGQAGLLLASETPDSNEGGGVFFLGQGSYTDLVETAYNDPNWGLESEGCGVWEYQT